MQQGRRGPAWYARPGLIERPTVRYACLILGSLLCVAGIYAIATTIIAHPNYPEVTDLDIYLRAASALPGNPYAPEVNPGFDRYGYPPLLADVMAALQGILGRDLLVWVWPIFCLGGLLGAIALLCRGLGAKLPWHAVLLVAGIVLIGRVVRSDIVQGQLNVIVLFLLAGGIILRSRNQVIAAAFLLAIMMSLKPFMGAVAVYFLLRRDWRMAAWTLGLGALVFLASFLPMGLNMLEGWNGWREATMYFTSPPFATKPDNQSAFGLALRLFTETNYATPWVNEPALVAVFMGCAIGLAATLAYIGMFLGQHSGSDNDSAPAAVLMLESSMVVALVTACGPLTEGNHMSITLAGLASAALIGMERIRARSAQSSLWIATILAWGLLAFFVVYPKILPIAYGLYPFWHGLEGLEILLTGRCGILLMLAGGLTAATLWQERKAEKHATLLLGQQARI